jgi:DDE superfamily endonuclease
LPMTPQSPAKQDYEYVRNGTTNLFVAVEPKAGKRVVSVTAHRAKTDFVAFIDELLTGAYAKARRIHLVLDNLNTHFRKCFVNVRCPPPLRD